MASRPRINPLSVLFILVVLAYAIFSTNRRPNPDAAGPAGDRADVAGRTLSPGQVLTGRVSRIVDGDTLDVEMANGETVRLRLEGIDAPERGQPFAREAWSYLGQLCSGKVIFAMVLDRDRYNRPVVDVYHQDVWVNGEMVKAGLAWHYRAYNDSPDLAALEHSAKTERRGLWTNPQPVAPWEYRQSQARQPGRPQS